jgi:hypothetical protein
MDRRKNMMKLLVAFCNFANASKNGKRDIPIQAFESISCLIFQKRIRDSKEYNIKLYYESHFIENVKRLKECTSAEIYVPHWP